MTTLKTNVKRTVRLEGEERGARRAVKRFHAPGLVQGRRDRRRAERELALGARLFALGLAVPEPLGLRRARGAWELVTRYAEDAAPLAAILAGERAWPAEPRRALERLAAALAAAHAAGLAHPDLHAGNLLVGPGGAPWLVDLAGARLRARPSVRGMLRDLVQLEADLRERLPEELRQRCLAAWRRALPAALRARLPSAARLARAIAPAARLHRRRSLLRQRGRWTRESGACRALEAPGLSAWVRRGLDADALLACAPGDELRLADGACARALVLDGLDGGWRALRTRWYAAARLEAHGLACAIPALLVRRPRPRAVLALPEGARPIQACDGGARLAAAAGELLGGLHDRGLAAPGLGPGDLWVRADGGRLAAGLGALGRLAEVDALDARAARRAHAGLAAALAPGEQDVFWSAFVAAQRCGARGRAELARGLARG